MVETFPYAQTPDEAGHPHNTTAWLSEWSRRCRDSCVQAGWIKSPAG